MKPATLAALLFVAYQFLTTQRVSAQASGKYYSGNGGYNNSCPMLWCPIPTNSWQYTLGCTFNSSGVFTNCSNAITAGNYYSSTGGLYNNCNISSCLTCGPGQWNPGCNSASQGYCTSCGTPATGFYWTTPLTPLYTCTQAAQYNCSAGFQNVGYNTISSGTCTACTGLPYGRYWTTPTSFAYVCTHAAQQFCGAGLYNLGWSTIAAGACQSCTGLVNGTYYINNTNATVGCLTTACSAAACANGQYVKDCTGTSNGTCTGCTNANATQVYTGTGSWNNLCPVMGCPLTCSTGYYTGGCGSVPQVTFCGTCTNSAPNVNYYIAGSGYTPGSCNTAACPISSCANGNYLYGCGNLSAGGCISCTNVV